MKSLAALVFSSSVVVVAACGTHGAQTSKVASDESAQEPAASQNVLDERNYIMTMTSDRHGKCSNLGDDLVAEVKELQKSEFERYKADCTARGGISDSDVSQFDPGCESDTNGIVWGRWDWYFICRSPGAASDK
jgi:hypothetical protein